MTLLPLGKLQCLLLSFLIAFLLLCVLSCSEQLGDFTRDEEPLSLLFCYSD